MGTSVLFFLWEHLFPKTILDFGEFGPGRQDQISEIQ